MDDISKILILHIDEELLSQEKALLEEEGLAVISLSDARYAVEHLEKVNPNLIIIGTEVPMINGYLPLTIFRSITQVPILAVGHREELVYILELGADRFIVKPVDRSLFRAIVHNLLRRYQDDHIKRTSLERIIKFDYC